MDTAEKRRLERYTKNATRFLWGLSQMNQKDTYPWLRTQGQRLWGKDFDFRTGSYSSVTDQLLQNPGIEKLIQDLVIPRVKGMFSPDAIDFLRTCWEAGTRPDMSFLRKFNMRSAEPFLEVNTQYEYVERWGDFAPVWFEEIEPNFEEARRQS